MPMASRSFRVHGTRWDVQARTVRAKGRRHYILGVGRSALQGCVQVGSQPLHVRIGPSQSYPAGRFRRDRAAPDCLVRH